MSSSQSPDQETAANPQLRKVEAQRSNPAGDVALNEFAQQSQLDPAPAAPSLANTLTESPSVGDVLKESGYETSRYNQAGEAGSSPIVSTPIQDPQDPHTEADAPLESALFSPNITAHPVPYENVLPHESPGRSTESPRLRAYRTPTIESDSDDDDVGHDAHGSPTPSHGHISELPSRSSTPLLRRLRQRSSMLSLSSRKSPLPLPNLTLESEEDLPLPSEADGVSSMTPEEGPVVVSVRDREGGEVHMTQEIAQAMYDEWSELASGVEPGALTVGSDLIDRGCSREDCQEIRNAFAAMLAPGNSHLTSRDVFPLAVLHNQLLRNHHDELSTNATKPSFPRDQQDCLTGTRQDALISALYQIIFDPNNPPVAQYEFHTHFQTIRSWRNAQAHQVFGVDIATAILRTYGPPLPSAAPMTITSGEGYTTLPGSLQIWGAGTPFSSRAFAEYAFRAVVSADGLTPEEYILGVREGKVVDQLYEDKRNSIQGDPTSLVPRDPVKERELAKVRFEERHTHATPAASDERTSAAQGVLSGYLTGLWRLTFGR